MTLPESQRQNVLQKNKFLKAFIFLLYGNCAKK